MNRRPENDPDLSQLVVNVQKLSASLDKVTRERGILGVANELSKIQAEARTAEWLCNDIIYGRKK